MLSQRSLNLSPLFNILFCFLLLSLSARVVMGTGWGFQGHRGEVAEAKTGIGLEGSRVLYAGHALAGW